MRKRSAFMKKFSEVGLKNKIFFSFLAVILIISMAIAFLARWILVSSLISELKLRGVAITRTIAERCSIYILHENYPQLLSLIYDESHLSQRRHLIAYIFILDQENRVLSHTFFYPFPDELRLANPVPDEQDQSIRLLTVGKQAAYDIAIPVREGLYRIGTVHTGLNKKHIDNLVSKLRFTFLGFISLVFVILFFISHKLSRYITRPISELTRISGELSRGNFDIRMNPDNVIEGVDLSECPAYTGTDLRCRYFDKAPDSQETSEHSPDFPICRRCVFYRKQRGDEVTQLADSFHKMVWSIKLYRGRLHESEEKYRSLFDSAPNPIFVIDWDTFDIIDINPRAMELYGYSREELIGKPFPELGTEHFRERMASFREDSKLQSCVYYSKILHRKKGDRPLFVNLHACNVGYEGKPAILIAVTDMTETMEKDAQIIQAGKMKSLGEMSAGIAHELNQPLNAIKMGSDFLAMMIENDLKVPEEDLRQVVTEISTQVDRAADIINTLRAFGRKAGLVAERVDINQSIRRVFSLVGRQFELENIHVKPELSEGISPIWAHDNRLQQVLFNLLTNARDAIVEKNEAEGKTDGGTITIRSYQAGNQVMVEVQDSGAGIPETVRDKVFEPFFTTKEADRGMGLGLAITYGIVKDYGGDIRIQSKEGEGTTFILSFTAGGSETKDS